jgi:hypothetical protein
MLNIRYNTGLAPLFRSKTLVAVHHWNSFELIKALDMSQYKGYIYILLIS